MGIAVYSLLWVMKDLYIINRIACLDLGHLSLPRKQLVGAGEAPGNEEDKAAFGSGSLNPKPKTRKPKP